MPARFKIGNIVQLKSGGPKMTVNALPTSLSQSYGCIWFAGARKEQGQFVEDTLQLYEEKEEKKDKAK